MNNLKLGIRNSKLIRSAQLLFVALLAISFMGADVDARFNKLGHQLMCMCLQPDIAGVQPRRLRVFGTHARRAGGGNGARRQRFASAAELRAEVRQYGAVVADLQRFLRDRVDHAVRRVRPSHYDCSMAGAELEGAPRSRR